jgi:hypothetical protein
MRADSRVDLAPTDSPENKERPERKAPRDVTAMATSRSPAVQLSHTCVGRPVIRAFRHRAQRTTPADGLWLRNRVRADTRTAKSTSRTMIMGCKPLKSADGFNP